MKTFPAAFAVVGVLGLVSLPAEHVHLIAEHGEHSEVVHRHLAPHHHTERTTNVDHDDGDAQYLSSEFTVPTASHGAPIVSLVITSLPLLQPPTVLSWALTSRHVRVHDPPWATALGLRAPPSLLV